MEPLPLWRLSAATVARAFTGLRATRTTLAPRRARASAVARPTPEVPPVTRQVLPAR